METTPGGTAGSLTAPWEAQGTADPSLPVPEHPGTAGEPLLGGQPMIQPTHPLLGEVVGCLTPAMAINPRIPAPINSRALAGAEPPPRGPRPRSRLL